MDERGASVRGCKSSLRVVVDERLMDMGSDSR